MTGLSFSQYRAGKNAPALVHTHKRYTCAAAGCPMAATIIPGGTNSAVCVYHYETRPEEWGRVSARLIQWQAVAHEIHRARRVLGSPRTCADLRAHRETMETCWRDLGAAIAPPHRDMVRPLENEHLDNWVRRLEMFMQNAVNGRLPGSS